MSPTAVASTPSSERRSRLTAPQQRTLRALVAEGLRTHRYRSAQAAAALDDFTSSDSPAERETAREVFMNLLSGTRDFEDALGRLDAGTYGVCSVCTQPIPFERLEAIPEVDRCVSCVDSW